ncbi:MAG: polysaccharide deacetylase family protein [Pirellulales bacterium]
MDRRTWVGAAASSAALLASGGLSTARPTAAWGAPAGDAAPRAQIAITLDLEMSAQYPQRGQTEWNYEKGNLDEPTKRYAVEAARLAREAGAVIHFFCVGRALEQPDISWLQEIARLGHPIGNHTYDHVNVKARRPEDLQFRFQRAPWLLGKLTPQEAIRENIRLTTTALQTRAQIRNQGFRTPGGFHNGLADAPEIQQMLLELGFSWVSSKYPAHPSGQPREAPTEDVYQGIVAAQREAQPFVYPSGLVEIPMSPISDVTAFRSHGWKLDYFLQALDRTLDWVIEQRAVFDFLAHPSCLVVEDPEWRAIQRICQRVAQAGERACFAGLDQIADRVRPATRPVP